MSSKSVRQVLRRRAKPRRTVPASPLISQLINAINAFPADWVPQHAIHGAATDVPPAQREQLLAPIYALFIERAPEPIKEIIGPVKGRFEKVERLYRLVEDAHRLLNDIAATNAAGSGPLSLQTPPEVAYIEEGTGHLKTWAPLTGLLQAEKVDCRRIRRCLNCDKLFWAGRSDRVCCSPACSLVWRSKKWRKAHSGE